MGERLAVVRFGFAGTKSRATIQPDMTDETEEEIDREEPCGPELVDLARKVQFEPADYFARAQMSDLFSREAPFEVTGAGAEPWIFAGTGLADGVAFGRYGVEIDARSPASPPGTVVLARIPSLRIRRRTR